MAACDPVRQPGSCIRPSLRCVAPPVKCVPKPRWIVVVPKEGEDGSGGMKRVPRANGEGGTERRKPSLEAYHGVNRPGVAGGSNS
jgi:hypothetical protein